jgi:hypothetical protein
MKKLTEIFNFFLLIVLSLFSIYVLLAVGSLVGYYIFLLIDMLIKI